MSVLECDRRGCENIMCDRMSDNLYICNECFDELVNISIAQNVSFKDFMESEPQRNMEESMRAYWEKRIPIMKGSPFYQEK